MVAEEKPARARFVAPKTKMLQAGMAARKLRPPATPIMRAAVVAPHTIVTLGAKKLIREPTYSKMRFRDVSNASAMSQASLIRASSSESKATPCVVEDVTLTTMIVADARISCKVSDMNQKKA